MKARTILIISLTITVIYVIIAVPWEIAVWTNDKTGVLLRIVSVANPVVVIVNAVAVLWMRKVTRKKN